MIHHISEYLFLSYPVDMLDHNTGSIIQWDEQAVEAIIESRCHKMF
jgi:hypothetical protein